MGIFDCVYHTVLKLHHITESFYSTTTNTPVSRFLIDLITVVIALLHWQKLPLALIFFLLLLFVFIHSKQPAIEIYNIVVLAK